MTCGWVMKKKLCQTKIVFSEQFARVMEPISNSSDWGSRNEIIWWKDLQWTNI